MSGRVDSSPYVIGVDLGGTKIAAARVSVSGEVGKVFRVPTPGKDGPDAILDACMSAIRLVMAGETEGPLAVGVGSAGTIDATSGTVVASTDVLRDWTGTNIVGGLVDRLMEHGVPVGVHVAVENDVNAHALGESWLGAGAGLHSAVVFAIGTGIGGAVVVNNMVVGGARHAGGDFGHIPAALAADLQCTCGKSGHIEAIASGPNIARLFNAEAVRAGIPVVADTREVFSLARAGDEFAFEILKRVAQAVGESLAAISCVVDPAVIILAGGVAHAWDVFVELVRESFVAHSVHGHADTPIVEASLGEDAAILGAVRHAINSSSVVRDVFKDVVL